MSSTPSGDVPADAPESCPGTQSESAGKEAACSGCPNQKICASGMPRAPDPDVDVIRGEAVIAINVYMTVSTLSVEKTHTPHLQLGHTNLRLALPTER